MIGLEDADLVVRPGRRLAILGPGGAGTSALAAVLRRRVDYDGSVTLGGVELRELSRDDVRRVIGVCAKDARLLDTTVAENVRLARPTASEEQVAAVAGRAGVAVPLHVRVGAHGSAVSPGERQRIALARALLADVPILVLDEPGSHLDDDTAEAVIAGLLGATRGRTVLLMTRRVALPGADPILRHVDEVVTLRGS